MNELPSELLELLVGLLLGIVGWNVRQLAGKVDDVSAMLTKNTGRLIRIETRLDIKDEE